MQNSERIIPLYLPQLHQQHYPALKSHIYQLILICDAKINKLQSIMKLSIYDRRKVEYSQRSATSSIQRIIYQQKDWKLEMKSYTACMTGFDDGPKEQEYKKMMERMNIRFSKSLAHAASVLIVRQVTTEKYKIAKVYQRPIPCVTISWLIESDKQSTILDPLDYPIEKIFYGVQAHMMGFNSQTILKLQTLLLKNGGGIQTIETHQLRSYIKKQQINILVIPQQSYHLLSPFINQINFCVVGIEWAIDSINAKMCKFPYDYAFNQVQLGRKITYDHINKMKNKLETELKSPLKCQDSNILADTIIYLGDSIHLECTKVLKKLIITYGGFYLQEMSPIITHILLQPLTYLQYLKYCSNGVLTHVLRIEWLIDSIYFNRRIEEQDYVIRSFKKLNSPMDDDKSIGNSSIHSNSQLVALRHNFDSSKKSISMPIKSLNLFYPKKNKHKMDSSIFTGKNFYVESSHRKHTQISNIPYGICKNSGKYYNSRRDIEDGLCYYVLNDSPDCANLIKLLKTQVKAKEVQIQPVSYRWVQECVAKGSFIDIIGSESYIYKPLPFKSPINQFYRLVFIVLMSDGVRKLRLKELYNVLGSVKNTPNKSEITHCLCGEGYTQISKYHEIMQQNKNAVFVDWRWLIECANKGKIVDTTKYLINSMPLQLYEKNE